jgi:hypothetical protein
VSSHLSQNLVPGCPRSGLAVSTPHVYVKKHVWGACRWVMLECPNNYFSVFGTIVFSFVGNRLTIHSFVNRRRAQVRG